MRKTYTLHESDINMIRLGYELLLVTNANMIVVKNAINHLEFGQFHSENGINELCTFLNEMGYMATWENFNDMRLEITI
jgi:hypothetical protein